MAREATGVRLVPEAAHVGASTGAECGFRLLEAELAFFRQALVVAPRAQPQKHFNGLPGVI
jgi:hypothetical protein